MRPDGRVRRRALHVGCVLVAGFAAFAPSALADGDPASDILLAQDYFTPYSPPLSAPYAKALRTILKDAHRAGWPVKVALIESPSDLGAYPSLFGHPQRYASLLAQEISFNAHPRVLAVMPQGFGTANIGAGPRGALRDVRIVKASHSDGLALAAITAVARMATADGHPVRAPTRLPKVTPATGGAGSGTRTVLFAAPLLLVLALAVLARRRRSEPVDS